MHKLLAIASGALAVVVGLAVPVAAQAAPRTDSEAAPARVAKHDHVVVRSPVAVRNDGWSYRHGHVRRHRAVYVRPPVQVYRHHYGPSRVIIRP